MLAFFFEHHFDDGESLGWVSLGFSCWDLLVGLDHSDTDWFLSRRGRRVGEDAVAIVVGGGRVRQECDAQNKVTKEDDRANEGGQGLVHFIQSTS